MPVDRVEKDFDGNGSPTKRLENQGPENQCNGDKPPQGDSSAMGHGVRGRLLPIQGKKDAEVKKGSQKESLESILSSALRSEDAELDEILSALEEIAESVRAGTTHPPEVEKALQKAASSAMKQSMLDREIRSLAITDELTGLYNRRGFLASATHQIKLAQRNALNVLLLFCDLDNLKGINDTYGHQEGDVALIRTADALEDTFRDSDIIARLGGDEFAVLASEASMPNREDILPRLEESLTRANATETRYQLSLSIGVARFDPLNPSTLGELMARADKHMYAHKKYSRRAVVSVRS
jgi:diguanylate cyclase (GGDEF)-like protein